jgi:hypothetical protein
MESFTLTLEGVGTVLAVDETAVTDLAADRLEASLDPRSRLFTESVTADVAEGQVLRDGRIAFTATVRGEQYEPLDQASLAEAVRGRSVSEARVILEPFGNVEIRPWPDFIGSVPDDPRRINVTILEPRRSGT